MADKLRTYDLSDIQTEEGFYKTLLDLYYRTRNVCLPAIVTRVQDENGYVIVQPMANYASPTRDGMVHTKRPEVRVWPIQFRHGGYKIHAPLFVGDTGYIIPGDRNCLAAMSANGNVLKHNYEKISEAPNKFTEDLSEFDMNKWEYGFFIPSSWEKPATKILPNGEVASDVNPRLVISNVQEGDKSAFITIDQDGNIVIHGASLDVEADTHFKKDVEVDGDLTLHGKLKFQKEDPDPEHPEEPDEDAAELVDTQFVTGLTDDRSAFKVWKGKVMRSEGDFIDPESLPPVKGQITLAASTNVVDGQQTELTMTATPVNGDRSNWQISLEGTVGGGGGVDVSLSSDATGTAPAKNLTLTTGDVTTPVVLIPGDPVTDEITVVASVTYSPSTRELKANRVKLSFVNGILMSQEAVTDDEPVFTAVQHMPEGS